MGTRAKLCYCAPNIRVNVKIVNWAPEIVRTVIPGQPSGCFIVINKSFITFVVVDI